MDHEARLKAMKGRLRDTVSSWKKEVERLENIGRRDWASCYRDCINDLQKILGLDQKAEMER